mgnify:FL=1
MKLNKYIPVAALSLMLLNSGCSDSFLEKSPSDYITSGDLEEVAKWNTNILMGQALGTYSTTFALSTGGVGGHDDFGQKAVDIATDLMSGDMVIMMKGYGWFEYAGDLTCSTRTASQFSYQFWRYYYRLIKAANEIIDAAGGDEAKPTGENGVYFAQAKALRAHSYFNLVNLYARPYQEDKTALAIPIYRTQLTSEAAKKSSVEEVYNLIVKDLTDAIPMLEGYERPSGQKDQINQAVAKGMLAYVYLMMGENGEAARLTQEVIDSKEFTLMNRTEVINSGFSSVSIPGWMWAIDLTPSNSPALPTFWGHMDLFTYSYAYAGGEKLIDTNLYNSIPDTDVRKKWFTETDEKGEQYELTNWWKFYNSKRILGNREWYDDEVYMRVAEMYLINAEANTRENNLSDAKISLKALLGERDTEAAAKVEQMGKEGLLDEIYFNWRLELWAEGRGLLTMKRFQKSITRCAEDAMLPGQTYDYKDERLTFKIPEKEIINNPNLDD